MFILGHDKRIVEACVDDFADINMFLLEHDNSIVDAHKYVQFKKLTSGMLSLGSVFLCFQYP